jgi:hypothetical protein
MQERRRKPDVQLRLHDRNSPNRAIAIRHARPSGCAMERLRVPGHRAAPRPEFRSGRRRLKACILPDAKPGPVQGHRAFLLPGISEYDDSEAQKMTKLWDELELPFKLGESVRLRAPCEGTYWQLKDGLIIRVAAEDAVQDAEAGQRALLALAVRDAVEQ